VIFNQGLIDNCQRDINKCCQSEIYDKGFNEDNADGNDNDTEMIDHALAFACQADVLKYCNDIPIGSGKQVQCLFNMGKSVTSQCQNILQKRQELWKSISNVNNVVDLTEQIRKSNNSSYEFIVILVILCTVFMAGCICGRNVRYNPIMNYDNPITIDHK
ncbi:unnamed protein product, partial [Rotaria sordida]